MFQFRSRRPLPFGTPPDCPPSVEAAAANSNVLIARADCRGWFDSSADLKCGLQVQEDDFDSLPADVRDAFPSR